MFRSTRSRTRRDKDVFKKTRHHDIASVPRRAAQNIAAAVAFRVRIIPFRESLASQIPRLGRDFQPRPKPAADDEPKMSIGKPWIVAMFDQVGQRSVHCAERNRDPG